MTRSMLLTSTLLALLLAPRLAHAGCPSSSNEGCDMAAAADAWLDPDPGCLSFGFDENNCTCSNRMTVVNNCADDLEAIDFTWCQWEYSEDCPEAILAGSSGTLPLPVAGSDALGDQTVQLSVRLGSSEHTLNVQYEMIHVQSGGCSASPAATSTSAPLWLGLLALAALAVRRRRHAPAQRR